jgi:DNA-binding MarR family transcriptional regulator
MDMHDEVLVALRQIIRAIDLYSKQIKRDYGLTTPQLLLLRAIQKTKNMTIRQLSNMTNMSQATATSILDRLEARQLVIRIRDEKDKRKVHAKLTPEGHKILRDAPNMIQQNVIKEFGELENWEQSLILSSLQRLSLMMNSNHSSTDTEKSAPHSDPMALLISPSSEDDNSPTDQCHKNN